MLNPLQPISVVPVGTMIPIGEHVIVPSTTYYYPCMVCLNDGTVATTGACRGHDPDKIPRLALAPLCPHCGK